MKIAVEIFSTPGCGRCAQAGQALKSVVAELGPDQVSWRDVNVLEELDHAVDLGVITPPSIAIDGALVFPKLPTADQFRAELMRRLRIGPAA